ncbi:sensor histidine kinase [Salinispirillum marinum]|uniref:histidine kinase n=2 Tax=Saccharospirillaceae TaxID=255527 RepID=A0ABV8BDT6_9GAMM
MSRVSDRIPRWLGSPALLVVLIVLLGTITMYLQRLDDINQRQLAFERHLQHSQSMVNRLMRFSSGFNGLAPLRSEYLSTLAVESLLSEFQQIRTDADLIFQVRGQGSSVEVEALGTHMTELSRLIRQKNDLLVAKNTLQVIVRENEAIFGGMPEVASAITIISEAFEANNLIFIGELSRRFNGILQEGFSDTTLTNRLRNLAFGSNGLFAVAEDLVITGERIERTIFQIRQFTNTLIEALEITPSVHELNIVEPRSAPWFWTVLVLLCSILVVGWLMRQQLLHQFGKKTLQANDDRLDSLGRISGEVAHDISNMINVIISSLNILKETKNVSGSHHQRSLDKALFAADKSIGMIDRLLTFARRKRLMPELFSINELIQGLYEVVCLTVGDNVDVKLDLFEGDTRVFLDPGQLESSIINLCINSRNAIDDQGVISIRTRIEQKRLIITVSDTGHGIPQHILPRVFEPFFTTDKEHNGQGLGLSTVYGFVKQSAGEITINSSVGLGTDVSMEFKL